MASMPKSRWEADDEDPAELARLKAEKGARKKAKEARKAAAAAAVPSSTSGPPSTSKPSDDNPSKRRKLDSDATPSPAPDSLPQGPLKLLRFPAAPIAPCQHVDHYQLLNHIEEGSYGIVSRALDPSTTPPTLVALKKLKLPLPSRSDSGFPITSLREIHTLMSLHHPNIVNLREIVMGDSLDQVYLVMDFIEHDLKTLSEEMQEPFLQSEIKTIMLQLLDATKFMHEHWVLHRDLKTSNLLMNNRGQIKIADFGLARFHSDTPRNKATGGGDILTQLVVTLWYRSPELLLGATHYGSAIDMWSIGCILAELLENTPPLQGKNEVDQLCKIFTLCGVPTESSWPGFRRLPNAKGMTFPKNPKTTGSVIRTKYPLLTSAGVGLLEGLLCLDPERRWSAEEALQAKWFKEDPRPKREEMFPTWPSKAGQERRRRRDTPGAPVRGEGGGAGGGGEEGGWAGIFAGKEDEEVGGGFMLKLGR